MDNKKKKYVVPEADVVKYANEDVIVTSLEDGGEASGGWDSNNNGENWWG